MVANVDTSESRTMNQTTIEQRPMNTVSSGAETDMRRPSVEVSSDRPAGTVERDRVADLLRVAALLVVVMWHSTFSLFHRNPSGALTMPNPIGQYRGLWMLTWVLQVMPLFFVVSGAVNASAWTRHRERGGTAWGFSRRRVARFVVPVGVLVLVCCTGELIGRLAFRTPFTTRHLVILVPLWTLALLIAYAPTTPWLDRGWRRWGPTLTVALVGVVVMSDLVRFRSSSTPAVVMSECISTVGVWLVAYQLGWVYRAAVAGGAVTTRATGRMLTVVGLVGLVISTNLGVYPRPMVATTTDSMSNLLPTTVPIMMLALFQCGLVLLVRPKLERWLDSDRVSGRLDSLGEYALPAYLFHMIAVVAVVLTVEALGVGFDGIPSGLWWATRPLWMALVAAVLVPLLAASRRVLARL